MYTCEEVAEIYGVKIFTVWDWIKRKKMQALKIGREYRIREEDLKKFEESASTIKDQGQNGKVITVNKIGNTSVKKKGAGE